MRASPLWLLTLFACTATGEGLTPTPGPPPDAGISADSSVATTTSYLRDIQPIFERSCFGCHAAGGAAPFAFDAPEAAIQFAELLKHAVLTDRMPPFYASAECNTYQRDPRLSVEEKMLLAKWADEGAPLGDPVEERHADPIEAPSIRHDVVMDIGGDFDARRMNSSDNYRCFVMDPRATSDLMVTGYEVLPGNKAIVHHVLAYLVPPESLAQLDANDAADPGLGYDCLSGGVGVQGAIANQVAGWVPGGSASKLPAGTGLEVRAGSKIVIQIHYNLLALKDGVSALDKTSLALETAPAGSLERARVLPAVKRNIQIPAGEKNSVQIQEIPLPGAAGSTVYRLTGHMHMLGKQVKLELLHSDGGSTCLLDIPNWDFNWQREYSLETPVTVRSGDRLRLTCVYDNSPENQPLVDGVPRAPRDVSWGESSLDEMCMTYLTFTQR